MKREDDQELWDLLGRTAQPAVSPFFARNVVRQIRQEPSWRERFSAWLAPRRLIPASVAALALIVAAVSVSLPDSSQDALPEPVAQLEPQDYEIVADLDSLLAYEEDGLWDDDTPTL
jgi:hypothetical protein